VDNPSNPRGRRPETVSEPKLKDLLTVTDEAVRNAPAHMTAAARPLRVLLIQPPETGGVMTLLPHFSKGMKNVGYKPPLGVLHIASMVKERSPHTVKVIDAIARQLSFEALLAEVVAFAPDVVGISAWTDFWWPAHRAGELIKAALPNAHLCYGGPHIGIYPHETLSVPFVDSVIVGDGEAPFLYLCNMIANGVEDNSFPGLHFKAGGVKAAPETLFIQQDLDALPIPDRALLPIRDYGSVLSKGDFVTTMVTSRGCPHRCTFCKLNFQKTIACSAERIVEEFRRIKALGIREVEIYDDTFTWGKARLREICEGLIADGNDVIWAVRDRVNSADGEMFDLMYRAGCRRIHFGVESGVQEVIDRIKKKITLDQAREAVKLAKRAGFTVLTYFMFGNLDETADDMERTVKFALELNADYCEFSITIPYAGTEMYTEALASGAIARDYWRDYALAPWPDMDQAPIINSYADVDELRSFLNDAMRRFYFRPRYILRELRGLASLSELMRKAQMGHRLVQSVYVK